MVRLCPWLICLLFLGITASRLTVPGFGTFNDDAVYIATARALADGRGYVIDTLPGAPPNTKYPPLCPAILSLVFLAGRELPGAAFWLKVPAFLFLLAWLAALYRLGEALGLSRTSRGWVLACTLASGTVAYCATEALSDVPFAALATWALLAMVRQSDQPTVRRSILVGGLAGLASLARSQGLVLVATAVMLLARSRRFREVAVCLGAASAIVGPWLWWQAAQPSPGEPLLLYYSAENYRSWWAWRSEDPAHTARIMLINTLLTILAPVQSIGIRNVGVGLAVGACLWLAAALAWRRRPQRAGPPALTTASTVGLLLGWSWPPGRMLLVVPPLLYLAIARGWTERRSRLLAGLAALVFCVLGLANAMRAARFAQQDGVAPFGSSRGDRWRTLVSMGRWLEEHSPPGAVIGAVQDGALSLLAQRPAIFPAVRRPAALIYGAPGPPLGTLAEFIDHLERNRIGYIVVTPSAAFSESRPFGQLIEQWRRSDPGALEMVYEPEPGYAIFRRTGRAAPSGAPNG